MENHNKDDSEEQGTSDSDKDDSDLDSEASGSINNLEDLEQDSNDQIEETVDDNESLDEEGFAEL
jgi:hypothetical protein